ncbi:MAG: dihydroneopterin aldolase [Alphaproteobacteria bacterium]|nr:dihydroneopterin aldolase [Alphaproteobacteria bacterium]
MPATPSLGGDYCVFVRNLTLHLPIGILDQERGQTQPVIVNVEMYVQDPGTFSSENIADYVSYADVYDALKKLEREEKHIELVENLAETVAAIALSQKGVRRAVVTIEKPEIIAAAESVGVTIERSN